MKKSDVGVEKKGLTSKSAMKRRVDPFTTAVDRISFAFSIKSISVACGKQRIPAGISASDAADRACARHEKRVCE